MAKETDCQREYYWRETVAVVRVHTVVPVHWDNFTRKLSAGLKPVGWPIDSLQATTNWLLGKAANQGCEVTMMGLRDSIQLRHGVIQ